MRHPFFVIAACTITAFLPFAAEASSDSPDTETTQNALSSVASTVGAAVADSISSVVLERGVSAGEGASGGVEGGAGQGVGGAIGVWGNFTGGIVGDDTASVDSDGSLYIGTVGADYRATAELLIGAALSVESLNVDFEPQGVTGNFEQTAVTISPYLAYQITDLFSVTAAAGYTLGTAEVSATTGGQTITGEADVARRFLSVSGAANTVIDNVITLGGDATLLYLHSKTDEYTASDGTTVTEDDSDLIRMSVGTRVGYLYGLSGLTLEPFATLGYAYDVARQDNAAAGHPDDKSELRLGGGLALYSADYGVGALEVKTKFRENVNETTFGLTYRYQF